MKILSFTFILCFLATISFGQAKTEKKIKPKRTDNFIRMKGIRVGTDITRPFQDLWTKGDRYGYEFSGDMELWPNIFPVFETGLDILKINTSYVNYKTSGSYSRIGFDYNFLQAENKNDKNIFYAGVRYGFVLAKQQVNSYMIDSYWGPTTGSFGSQNFFAHWGEMLVGLKSELFHNFYLGWTIRGKINLNQKDLKMPALYFSPGYGRAEKGFNMDFTYSVYYNLPWDFRKNIGKSKKVPVKIKPQTEKKPATKK